MTDYQTRLRRKAARYQEWAEKREQRAREAIDAAHGAVDRIEPGQPILLGHHSQTRHEKALRRYDAKMGEHIEHVRKAETFSRRAERAENHAARIDEAVQLSSEDYQPGDIVRARFTNGGYVHRFEGEIVGRTLNYWKIRATVSPYADQGEEPGRVYRIPCEGRRGYTANNRIEGRL